MTKSGTIYYPLWLSHAAGLLEKRGHQVLLLDLPAAGGTLAGCRDRVVSFDPDILVFDTSTPSIENDVRCLEEVKTWFTFKKTGVLVGTHPSAVPRETFALSRQVDAVARREYDWTLCELADRGGDPRGVAGLSYRDGDDIVDNPDRAPAEDLDELPFVSGVYRKHLDIRHYFYAHCKNPVVSIFAGRGCPNRCSFCVYPQVMFGHRYRHRTAKHLVDELEYIARQLPEVREVLIDDDNFTADQPFVETVCDEILRRGLKTVWTCEARVGLRYEVMRKMKEAGCRLLVTGFESGDQGVLDASDKGATLEQARTFAANARRAGLRVHGCFMAGNKGETRETLEKTLAFALSLPLDTAQFFPLMVYPGTKAYAWAEGKGYIAARRYRDWLTADGMHACVLDAGELSSAELVAFCDRARRRFYLRPRYVAARALDVLLHPSEAGRTFRAALSLAHHLFRRQG